MLSPNLTIGLDVGDQRSSWCMVDGAGRVLERGQVRTVGTALRRLFERRPRSRVVLEVGTHSPWVSRLLGDLGHEVLVANARQLRLIYGRDRKNDRVDAETLARLGRVDPALLRPIHHRGAEAQADLRRWGLLLAARGGKNAKKRAVVAVARKLATLLHHLWIGERPYEPVRGVA